MNEKNNNSENKTKQPVKQVISNNIFWLSLMFKASPKFMWLMVFDAAKGQLSIFMEHTLLIGYVLEAAEFHYPFQKVGLIIILAAGLITLGMLLSVWIFDYIGEQEKPKIKEQIKLLLYNKAKELDLSCYDDPNFYNEQVLVLSEIDAQIERGYTFIQNLSGGIAAFVSTGIFFIWKDKISAIFVLVAFFISYYANLQFNKLSFKLKMDKYPDTRKRDYIKRVFYMSEYAKEIRLNPHVTDVLMDQFEEANENVYKIEKKYANKKWAIKFIKSELGDDFIANFLYVAYLVFQSTVRKVMSFSTLVILFNSFYRMKDSLNLFTDAYPYAAETSLYVQKIRDFLGYEPKIVSEKNLLPKEGAKEISVKNIDFGYDEKTSIISDLSLNIKRERK